MRKLFVSLAVVTVFAVVAATAFAATSVSWRVGTSKTVKIRKGGVVKWVWADGKPHNVKGPGFRSDAKTGKGKTYSHRFRKRGTFKIICEVHPKTMKTIVKVG